MASIALLDTVQEEKEMCAANSACLSLKSWL